MAKRPWLFTVALLWNVAVGLPLALAPAQAVTLLGLTAPAGALAEYNARMLGFAIIVFGFFYFELGHDPAHSRRFLVIAIVAKSLTVALGLVTGFMHPELWPLIGGAIPVDGAFAALFFRELRRGAAEAPR